MKMKKLMLVLALILFSLPTLAAARQMICKSIDVTHRPYYLVKIYQFDVTHPGYYVAEITKISDLAGKQKESVNLEGPGTVEKHAFSIEFGEYKNGRFIKSGNGISGRRLPNGYLKAEMNLGEDSAVELACK